MDPVTNSRAVFSYSMENNMKAAASFTRYVYVTKDNTKVADEKTRMDLIVNSRTIFLYSMEHNVLTAGAFFVHSL